MALRSGTSTPAVAKSARAGVCPNSTLVGHGDDKLDQETGLVFTSMNGLGVVQEEGCVLIFRDERDESKYRSRHANQKLPVGPMMVRK